jgi:hypothetical protein
MSAIRAALSVCAIGAALVGAAPAVGAQPVSPVGWCLFGHVDPNNTDSACRGSDSAVWPRVPADPHGNPLMKCNEYHDGEHVSTVDKDGTQSRWICIHVSPVFDDPYWEWTEVAVT